MATMETIRDFERYEFIEQVCKILTNSLVKDKTTWEEITKLTHKTISIKQTLKYMWDNKKNVFKEANTTNEQRT